MTKKLHIACCLEKYARDNAIRLHMPGHKGENLGFIGDMFSYDITELSFSDNLADANGVIAKAQKDIAKICGAKRSFILTGGSSLGVLSMVYAVKTLGKKMIVPRSSHKSVFNALSICGIEPIILNERLINGLPSTTFENESLLECADNDVIGALITSPNYFGQAFDLKKIANLLHSKGKLLLVDGAHGAHFAFENLELYPANYADAWVDGAHKTLYTLTQGAILHLNELSLEQKVKDALSIFSTSSPSYPIMATVESGVKCYCDIKKANLKNFNLAKNILLEGVKNLGFELLDCNDPLKVTINLKGLANGFKVAKALEMAGVFIELYNADYLLLMLSYRFNSQSAKQVVEVLSNIKKTKSKTNRLTNYFPSREMAYLTAISAPCELVPIKESLNRICAENAGVFPPCYPIILAGEVFDNAVIDRLLTENTFGCYEGKVKVVKEN